jgi:hypothetical protein
MSLMMRRLTMMMLMLEFLVSYLFVVVFEWDVEVAGVEAVVMVVKLMMHDDDGDDDVEDVDDEVNHL